MNSWHEELDRRCVGTNRSGERCGRAPIPGGTVCLFHGGSAPQAQAAAKVRLLAMVEPVLGVFESIVETYNSTRCEACGKPTGDPMPVIRVGQLVLDRAGFHPTLTVEHVPPPNAYEDLTVDDLIEKLEAMLAATIATRTHALPEATDTLLALTGCFVLEEDGESLSAPKPKDDATTWSNPPVELTKEPAGD